jgi:hypothetical protein
MGSGVIQGSFLQSRPSGAAVRPLSGLAPAGRPAPLAAHVGAALGAKAPNGLPMAQLRPRPRACEPGTIYQVDPLVLRKSGAGQPLSRELRQQMERVFGAHFSEVRVHVGPQAGKIGAQAFAVGSDLFFAPGKYDPKTPAGRQLIGHELAHVVQQRTGRARGSHGERLVVLQDPLLEAEAERMGRRVARELVLPAALPARPGRLADLVPTVRGACVQRMQELVPSKKKRPISYEMPDKLQIYEGTLQLGGDVQRRFQQAKEAIAYAKSRLPFGAANIARDVEQSRNWGPWLANEISSTLDPLTSKVADLELTETNVPKVFGYGGNRSDDFRQKNIAAYRSIVARKLGSGVCDDFAAVVLFKLETLMGEEDEIYRLSVETDGPTNDHAVVILGAPGFGKDAGALVSDAGSVVVDAWPTKAFPVLAGNWIYRSKPAVVKFSVRGIKSTNRTSYKKLARAVFENPYSFSDKEEDKAYRRIGDDDPGAGKYAAYLKIRTDLRLYAEKQLREGSQKIYESPWSNLWQDLDSLDSTG